MARVDQRFGDEEPDFDDMDRLPESDESLTDGEVLKAYEERQKTIAEQSGARVIAERAAFWASDKKGKEGQVARARAEVDAINRELDPTVDS